MANIAAIVVTYNRKDLLLENVRCLLDQTSSDRLDIIVVDNASTDGTEAALHDFVAARKIAYVNTGENLGGAGGFHFGIRYAATKGYDCLWLMDDDSMPQSDALEKLLQWDEVLGDSYGFLASKVLWTDGSVCNMNVPKCSISKKVTDFSSQKVPVISSTFVSLFLRTERVYEFGLPIKEFFIWCDDLEYTRRISEKYPCYLINSSVVVHKTANNVGSNIAIDSYDRLNRYRYAYRNEVYYFRREGVKGFFYDLLRLATHVLRVLLKAPDHKKERLAMIFKATKEGLHFRPAIEFISKQEN